MCTNHVQAFQTACVVLLSTLCWNSPNAGRQSRDPRPMKIESTLGSRVPSLRIAARGESTVGEYLDSVNFELPPVWKRNSARPFRDRLFSGGLWQSTNVPFGFEPAQALTCRLSAKGLGKDENATLFEVLSSLAALPTVTGVGATTTLPLAGHAFSFVVAIRGMSAPGPDEPPTSVDVVSTTYFQTLGATLEIGRDFEATDTASSRQVAIVNQAFARQYSPGSDVVGRQLSLGGRPDDANVAVVGIVRDILDGAPGERVHPTVYRPFAQAAPQIGWHTATLVARTEGDPMAIAQPIKDALERIVPAGAVYDCDTLEHRIRARTGSMRERTGSLQIGSP